MHVLTIVALVASLAGAPVSSAARSPVAASAPPSAAFVDQPPFPISLPPDTLAPVAESPLLAAPIAVGRDDAPSAAEGPAQTEPPLPVVNADEAVIGPEGGAFRSLDGRITVEVPPGAVGGAVRFRYAAAAFAPGQGRSYLAPGVMRLTADDATLALPVTTFAKPLTLRAQVDVRALGWPARRLALYYYAPDLASWVALAGVADGAGGIVAQTDHFTDFAAGKGPEDKIIPSIQGFTVDLFSGAATFGLPIDVPPGRNGLQPSLSLVYSSGAVDDTYNSDQDWQNNGVTTISGGPHNGYQVRTGYHRQAAWTGLGWNLSGLHSLARDISGTLEYSGDDSFFLNLGGSFKLVWSGSEWKTDPDGYVKIERYGSDSECNGLSLNQNPDCRWKATTADGTQHLFTVGTTQGYATHDNCNNFTRKYLPTSWTLSTITDTHGNTINYSYSTVDNTENAGCSQTVTSHSWVYPATIAYPEANMAAVEFITATRQDDVDWGAGQHGNWKLDAIVVKHGGGQVRKYALSYDYGHAYRVYGAGNFPGRLILTGVTQYDTGSGTLPPYQFAYNQCADPANGCPSEDSDWKRDYLRLAVNGWGGRVEYDYLGRAWPSYHKDGVSTLYSCGPGQSPCGLQASRLRVNKRMWFGGVGGFFQEVFSYGTPLGQVAWVDGSNQFHGYEFLGHDWAQVTTYAPNGSAQVEKTVKQWFYQYPKPGEYKADPRKGKGWQTATSGLSLATPVTTTTEVALAGTPPVNVIYTKAVTQTMGTKSSVISYTVDTYGNVNGVYNQGDKAITGDEQTTLTGYLYNTSAWIVNRPTAQNVFTGTNPDTTNWTNLAANTRYHYDSERPDDCAPATAAPSLGDLVQTCAWITGTITAAPTYAKTRYAYDQWGNQAVITDANGIVQARTKWDDTYHSFPVIITNAVGLTQTQTVEAATGKPTALWDANGAKTELAYDSFKRLEKVIEPYDSASYPTLQYGYGGIPSPYIRNGNMEGLGDWDLASGTGTTVKFTADHVLIGGYSLGITTTNTAQSVVRHVSLSTPQAGKSYVVSAKVRRASTSLAVSLRVYDGQNTFTVGSAGGAAGTWEWVRGIITTTLSPAPTAFEVQIAVSGAASNVRIDDVQASAPYAVRTDKREVSGQSGTLYSRSVYNGLGQLMQSQAEFDATQDTFQDFGYAAAGWKTSESVPYLTTLPQSNGMPWKLPDIPSVQPKTLYAYDALGRTTTITNTDGAKVQTAYQDWKTALVDENQRQKISEVDGLGRTKVITETTGTYATPSWSPTFYAKTLYSYDVLGALIQVDNTDNSTTYTTGMVYDRAGRKARMDDPDMGTWRYWYDLAGNLTAQRDARGQVICFYYDAANRLTGKFYPSDGVCPGSPTMNVSYTYDAFDILFDAQYGRGRRTGMTDGSGSTTWKYDQRGRLWYEYKAISGVTGTPFVTQWSYDALNRPATMTYPGSEVVTTGYNAAGLPSSLSTSLSGTPYVGETQYTAWGAVDLRKLGASGSPVLQTDYIYFGWTVANGRGRLNQIKTGTTGTPDSLQNLTYKYDAIGNVTTITDTKAGGTQIQAFTYDQLHRLATAQATGGTGGTYAQETYQYNFAGNLTSKAGRTFAYTETLHVHAVGAATGGDWFKYRCDGVSRGLAVRRRGEL